MLQWFRQIDRDGSGTLDVFELQVGEGGACQEQAGCCAQHGPRAGPAACSAARRHRSPCALQKALALGQLNFSLKTVQALMRLHDRDGSGQIDYPVGGCGRAGGQAGGRAGSLGSESSVGRPPVPLAPAAIFGGICLVFMQQRVPQAPARPPAQR